MYELCKKTNSRFVDAGLKQKKRLKKEKKNQLKKSDKKTKRMIIQSIVTQHFSVWNQNAFLLKVTAFVSVHCTSGITL